MDMTSQDVNAPVESVNTNTQDSVTEPPNQAPETIPDEKPNEWESRFSKLSKRESKLTQWEKRLKDSQQHITEYNKIQELAKNDPSAVLEQLGISWDDLVSAHIERTEADQKDPTQKSLEEIRAETQKLKDDIAARDKRELEKQQESTKSQVVDSLMQTFEDGKADYKFLSRVPEEQLKSELFEAAVEVHKQTGKVPTSQEVCQLLEGIYEDQYKPFADIFNPRQETSEEPQPDDNNIQIPGLNTTSPNSSTQQTPNKEPGGMLPLDERKRRAALALEALGK